MKNISQSSLIAILFGFFLIPIMVLGQNPFVHEFQYRKGAKRYMGEMKFRLSYEDSKGVKQGIAHPLEAGNPVTLDPNRLEFPVKIFMERMTFSWDLEDEDNDAQKDFNKVVITKNTIELPSSEMSVISPSTLFRAHSSLGNSRLAILCKESRDVIQGEIIIDLQLEFGVPYKGNGTPRKRDIGDDITIPILIKASIFSGDDDGDSDTNQEGQTGKEFEANLNDLGNEWQKIQNNPTVDDINNFIPKLKPYAETTRGVPNPFQRYLNKANSLLNNLITTESRAYTEASTTNELEKVERYLRNYKPEKYNNENHIITIKGRKQVLEQQQSDEDRARIERAKYNKAKTGTIQDCEEYIEYCQVADCSNDRIQDITDRRGRMIDKIAWDDAKKKNNIQSYKKYFSNFPYGANAKEARKRYDQLIKQLRETNAKALYVDDYTQIDLDLSINVHGGNTFSPASPFKLVIKQNEKDLEKTVSWKKKDGEYEYEALIKDLKEGLYEITISDEKNETYDFDVVISTPQNPSISLGRYQLAISEGQPPFEISILGERGNTLAKKSIGKVRDYEINPSDFNLSKGTYQISVIDIRGASSETQELVVEGGGINIPLIIGIAVGVILLGLILSYLLVKSFRNWVKVNILGQAIRGPGVNKSLKIQPNANQPGSTSRNREIKMRSTESAIEDHSSGDSKIKISSKRNRQPKEERNTLKIPSALPEYSNQTDSATLAYFNQIAHPEHAFQYLSFNQTDIWSDTMVEEVFFSRKAIIAIDRYILEEHHTPGQFAEGEENEIPEVGGFLMGKFMKNPKSGRYKISIEQFVKSEHDNNTVYQVAFEDKAWEAYNNALEQYPELSPLGWFHTHPGHGLFLSRNDEKVHGQFPEPYQVAMEIDDKSRNFDVAFFARTSRGNMNNRFEGEEKNWFSWIEVQTWIRRAR